MPNPADITNQRELLDAHRLTLAAYLRREALQGEAHAAPEIVNGIRAARTGIARCKAALREWGETVEDQPDDVEPEQHNGIAALWNRPATRWLGGAGTVALLAVIVVLLVRGPSTTVNGSNIMLNNGTIENLTINAGDSPEARQQKVDQAKALIVQDTLANIGSLDARLGYVAAALAPVADPLQAARQTVAPASQAEAETGYQQLVAVQQVAALRQSVNGRPLRLEFGAPLVQVLVDSGTDASNVRSFYDELAATNDATESLLATLESAGRDAGDAAERSLWADKIGLARDTLQNRSQTAHLFGLLALHDMGATPTDAAALDLLRELEPRQLVDTATIERALQSALEQAGTLTERRQTLLAEEQQQLATTVSEYQAINEQLVVQPSDTQDQVVEKARSLRDLGRIDEAVAAFARYGDMFKDEPTAEQYAQVAQAFTKQLEGLQVSGGAYVFAVVDGSAAQQAGITVGDILVAYNGVAVGDVDQATLAIKAAPPGTEVVVEWLRLDTNGQLVRQEARVPAGSLGVGMMLI